MTNPEPPRLYLITPPVFEPAAFTDTLAAVLDGIDIACLRLALPGMDADTVGRAADALREVCHARDVALVVADHLLLAQTLGLDGVHLGDGAKSVRAARKALGPDAIVGAFCGTSRHTGLSAGEAGADYVAFGPVAAVGLGDGATVDREVFEWWSEMIEIPVVAEGGLDAAHVASLAAYTDFFGVGTEIWGEDDPLAALRALTAGVI